MGRSFSSRAGVSSSFEPNGGRWKLKIALCGSRSLTTMASIRWPRSSSDSSRCVLHGARVGPAGRDHLEAVDPDHPALGVQNTSRGSDDVVDGQLVVVARADEALHV